MIYDNMIKISKKSMPFPTYKKAADKFSYIYEW